MNAQPESEGWYPDPLRKGRLRFFDGREWSDRVHPVVSSREPPSEAGWWPDPLNTARSRFFDGSQWTDSVRESPSPDQASTDLSSPTITLPGSPAPPTPTSPAPPVPSRDLPGRFSLGDQSLASPGTTPEAPPLGTVPQTPTKASAHGIPRWVFLIAGGVLALGLGVMILQLSNMESTTRSGTSSSVGNPARPTPSSNFLSQADVQSLINRVVPGWSTRASETDPRSAAVSAVIIEPTSGSGQYGEFAAIFRYANASDATSGSEVNYLDGLLSQFRQAYFQEWELLTCGNIVVVAPGVGIPMFEEEMPSGVRCQ